MSVKPISTIIFDLGGVILNIDTQRTVEEFRNLGWKDFYHEHNQASAKELFYQLEKGFTSPAEFRNSVRQMLESDADDIAIDSAWSAMILDIPHERITYLLELRKHFRLFLLSNTNEIHRIKFHREFEQKFGYSFYNLFEHNFYSHEMGMRKPDPQIYLQTLKEAHVEAEETLFVDDITENTEAARLTGMKVLNIRPGKLLEQLPLFLNESL